MLQIAASRGSDTDTNASDTSGGDKVVSAVRGQNNPGQCEATLHMQASGSNTVSVMSISDRYHRQRISNTGRNGRRCVLRHILVPPKPQTTS
ncbi:uncharacterized protein ColSpa_10190 [Colletotrichum spaethianum]|uniref:Uncharacterized protein n=1 Tax=Colletotrichum spaethianum TaxID=700344 RepID=A0AA37UJN8_9PEZI|nr:uncharacterized protein ColSpa_10190 [Colletotrichum spaethianum]GKT50009.1 hypothetical protein ColSpa_10190 [Colletotrichum spaethianum]